MRPAPRVSGKVSVRFKNRDERRGYVAPGQEVARRLAMLCRVALMRSGCGCHLVAGHLALLSAALPRAAVCVCEHDDHRPAPHTLQVRRRDTATRSCSPTAPSSTAARQS